MEQVKEVSGSDLTLLEEVRVGHVPTPRLMGFNEWQQWRRDYGRRPSRAVDGFYPGPRDESLLWRRTMEALHGNGWQEDLAVAEAVGIGGEQDGGPVGSLDAIAEGSADGSPPELVSPSPLRGAEGPAAGIAAEDLQAPAAAAADEKGSGYGSAESEPARSAQRSPAPSPSP